MHITYWKWILIVGTAIALVAVALNITGIVLAYDTNIRPDGAEPSPPSDVFSQVMAFIAGQPAPPASSGAGTAVLNIDTCGCKSSMASGAPQCRLENTFVLQPSYNSGTSELTTTVTVTQEKVVRGTVQLEITNNGAANTTIQNVLISLEKAIPSNIQGNAPGPSGKNFLSVAVAVLNSAANAVKCGAHGIRLCPVDNYNKPFLNRSSSSATIESLVSSTTTNTAFGSVQIRRLDNDNDTKFNEDSPDVGCFGSGVIGTDDDADGRVDEDGICQDRQTFLLTYSFVLNATQLATLQASNLTSRLSVGVTYLTGATKTSGTGCALDVNCDGSVSATEKDARTLFTRFEFANPNVTCTNIVCPCVSWNTSLNVGATSYTVGVGQSFPLPEEGIRVDPIVGSSTLCGAAGNSVFTDVLVKRCPTHPSFYNSQALVTAGPYALTPHTATDACGEGRFVINPANVQFNLSCTADAFVPTPPACAYSAWSSWSPACFKCSGNEFCHTRQRTSAIASSEPTLCARQEERKACDCNYCRRVLNSTTVVSCQYSPSMTCSQENRIDIIDRCETNSSQSIYDGYDCGESFVNIETFPFSCDSSCPTVNVTLANRTEPLVIKTETFTLTAYVPLLEKPCRPDQTRHTNGTCLECTLLSHQDPCLAYEVLNNSCVTVQKCRDNDPCTINFCNSSSLQCVRIQTQNFENVLTQNPTSCSYTTCDPATGVINVVVPSECTYFSAPVTAGDLGCGTAPAPGTLNIYDPAQGRCVVIPDSTVEENLEVVQCLTSLPTNFTIDAGCGTTSPCLFNQSSIFNYDAYKCRPHNPCDTTYCVGGVCKDKVIVIGGEGNYKACQRPVCIDGVPGVVNDNSICDDGDFTTLDVCAPSDCPNTVSGCRHCAKTSGLGSLTYLDECVCGL